MRTHGLSAAHAPASGNETNVWVAVLGDSLAVTPPVLWPQPMLTKRSPSVLTLPMVKRSPSQGW